MHIHLNKHTISNSRSVSIQETGDGEGAKNHPFFLLVEYFYSRVGRKLSWKQQCAKKHVSDIVSVSDEVFSLLVLENCWDVWLHKAMMKGHEDDTPAPKYVYTGTGGQGKRYGGWDAKGYARFNSLYDIVVHQRTTAMSRQLEISFKSNLLFLIGVPQG